VIRIPEGDAEGFTLAFVTAERKISLAPVFEV
jgi:hypothetical protein